MRSLADPPPRSAFARFDPAFGQRFMLTIDTEAEFDRARPLVRDGHGLEHVPRLAKFQQFCEREGVVPLYLVDWPVARSARAAEILRGPLAAGQAEIGIRLHPWVTPPFDEDAMPRNAFAGNLPRELEQAKFRNLRDEIARNFGSPRSYRAGRYGVGPNSPAMLAEAASRSTPRCARSSTTARKAARLPPPPARALLARRRRRLLELPLTTVFWGMLRSKGEWLYPAMWRCRGCAGCSRGRLLERIPLTPEGVSVDEAIRGIDIALDDGLPLLVFSFHSPSLRPGHTPTCAARRSRHLYDWWRRVFAYLELRGVARRPCARSAAVQR
jgi:hypothetical protein